MNAGERDELLVILKLLELQKQGMQFDGNPINSINCGCTSCGNLSANLNLSKVALLGDLDLTKLCNQCGISKAPSGAKSDVIVNGIGYSIKSTRMAPPALVNHTARPGFENVCLNVGQNIQILDSLIADYWQKRNLGIIREDISNSSNDSPFKDNLEYFRPILNYYLFTGTGSRKSSFPAEKILSVSNPIDEKTWQFYDKNNALDLFWDKLVFSLRASKGMPIGYPDKMSAKALLTKPSVDIWTKFSGNKYRGALHIRSVR